MKQKRIALIGCGGLGQEIAEKILSGSAGNYTLCGIYTNTYEHAVAYSKMYSCTAYSTLDAVFEDAPDFLIEAAGAATLREILESALKHRIPVIPLSIGIFADKVYLQKIQQLAIANQTHVYLPSGAVGGFDLMGSAALDDNLQVSIQTEKPPKALADAPFLKNIHLSEEEAQPVFHGNAVDAIAAFPKNINVAVAVGLATVGSEQLSVSIISNPSLSTNQHTVELDGEFGHAKIQIMAKPSSNAHSSKLAAYSVVSLLKRLDSWIGFL